MIKNEEFYRLLIDNGIDFFSGVPDSLLKDICAYITDNVPSSRNVITANEGGAVALSSGYYLATGKIPLVYMQNSGQGNSVNPLISLCDSEVYSIPILLLIGWRGEPGVKDEPQHVKQGRITKGLFQALCIPYSILPKDIQNARWVLDKAIKYMEEESAPYALIVREGTFEHYELKKKIETNHKLNRESAIKLIIDELNEKDVIVSTTGKISRELFEYREKLGQDHDRDFLTVGSMGHSSQIALGIALSKPERQVYCLDGDGALIMHMGSLAVIGQQKQNNFKHIVINNGAHDSVGGQPTAGYFIDITNIAKACGYKIVLRAETIHDVKEKFKLLKSSEGPAMLEIRVDKGARKDLGRPLTKPIENKNKFMEFLRK